MSKDVAFFGIGAVINYFSGEVNKRVDRAKTISYFEIVESRLVARQRKEPTMYAGLSIQNAKLVSVVVYPELPSRPVILRFDGTDGKAWGEVTFHTENRELAVALAEAIGGVISRFDGVLAQPHVIETVGDDDV